MDILDNGSPAGPDCERNRGKDRVRCEGMREMEMWEEMGAQSSFVQ